MKDKLIKSGVKNLIEFGYPDVTAENILTDHVYSEFFIEMLEDVLDEEDTPEAVKQAVQELLNQMNHKKEDNDAIVLSTCPYCQIESVGISNCDCPF
jgi:hypothetical protein